MFASRSSDGPGSQGDEMERLAAIFTQTQIPPKWEMPDLPAVTEDCSYSNPGLTPARDR
jgi:hypothetical protein